MSIKIAINGLGRIGRCVARIVSTRKDVELVAINASGSEDMIEYNLKYDSVHLKRTDVKVENGYVNIGNDKAILLNQRDPSKLDFKHYGAEIVLECTGAFLTSNSVQTYIDKGIKKVILSAPAKDNTPTFVLGVNDFNYKGEQIISNASCTTNGLAPIVKVLDDCFGVDLALMTTIHSYTSSQPILDAKHSNDPRKGRAGAINLIPASTGAAKAISKVLPHLKGKINGQAIRVPTPNVSMVDLTVTLNKNIELDDIKKSFIEAANGNLKNILGIDDKKQVSSDFIGESNSTVVPLDTIQVVGNKMVKILSWYDNEWGYSARLVDMAIRISK